MNPSSLATPEASTPFEVIPNPQGLEELFVCLKQDFHSQDVQKNVAQLTADIIKIKKPNDEISDILIKFLNSLNAKRRTSIEEITPAEKENWSYVNVIFKQWSWKYTVVFSPDQKSLDLFVTADTGKDRHINEKFMIAVEKLFLSVDFSCPMKIWGHKHNIPFDEFDGVLEKIITSVDTFIKHSSNKELLEENNIPRKPPSK